MFLQKREIEKQKNIESKNNKDEIKKYNKKYYY